MINVQFLNLTLIVYSVNYACFNDMINETTFL